MNRGFGKLSIKSQASGRKKANSRPSIFNFFPWGKGKDKDTGKSKGVNGEGWE